MKAMATKRAHCVFVACRVWNVGGFGVVGGTGGGGRRRGAGRGASILSVSQGMNDFVASTRTDERTDLH